MQKRHQDRQQYFNELANTARKYYIDYLQTYLTLTPHTRVLEIGCGEGGNLLPFAEAGCEVKGIDLSETRIQQAHHFFEAAGQQATFACENFITADKPATEEERYDGYLQYENGVGMVRLMETEVRAELSELTENAPPGFSVPCRSISLTQALPYQAAVRPSYICSSRPSRTLRSRAVCRESRRTASLHRP